MKRKLRRMSRDGGLSANKQCQTFMTVDTPTHEMPRRFVSGPGFSRAVRHFKARALAPGNHWIYSVVKEPNRRWTAPPGRHFRGKELFCGCPILLRPRASIRLRTDCAAKGWDNAPHPAFSPALLQIKHLFQSTLGPRLGGPWVTLGSPRRHPWVTQSQSQSQTIGRGS
jgi:hypothetical protein